MNCRCSCRPGAAIPPDACVSERMDCQKKAGMPLVFPNHAVYPPVIKRGGGGKNKAMFEAYPTDWKGDRSTLTQAERDHLELSDYVLEDIAQQHDRKMFWLKWTVIFPFMLVLVISLFLLFSQGRARADVFHICAQLNSMPRTCESVQKVVNRYGNRLAFWIARKCGASEQDLTEARQCLQPKK